MRVYYGIADNTIDVTNICIKQLMVNNIITVPSGDNNRAAYFTDPLIGVHKSIFIEHNGNMSEYDEYITIQINMSDNTITISESSGVDEPQRKISSIHSTLKILHGGFHDELPEQKMAVRYLTGTEKVLEIGGNIGRNSLVIASILENKSNLVVLESDPNIANQLTENRDLNHFTFHIERAALSNRRLIQTGWETKPSDILLPGYNWVNTITLAQLNAKYNIDFDTLVLDCEGAFYYILMDTPEILDTIKLIIMENDYTDITHKHYIDGVMIQHNFYREYVEAGGWGPCNDRFFEVWKRP